MLKKFQKDIWIKDYPLSFMGIPLGTKMTVVRYAENKIVLISPVPLDEQEVLQIRDLGAVFYIIAPNNFHHLFVAETKEKFSEAKVLCSLGLEKKRSDIAFDEVIQEPKDLEGGLTLLPLVGFGVLMPSGRQPVNEIVIYHPPSKTLILTDLVININRNSSFQLKIAGRFLGIYEKLQPSRLEKLGTKNRQSLAPQFKKVLSYDFDKIVPAHGEPIVADAKKRLQEGLARFLS